MEEEKNVSEKSRFITLLFCMFLGWSGVHRFYVNKFWTGLIMMFTMGIFGILWFLDFVMILVGAFKDSEELLIKRWN